MVTNHICIVYIDCYIHIYIKDGKQYSATEVIDTVSFSSRENISAKCNPKARFVQKDFSASAPTH